MRRSVRRALTAALALLLGGSLLTPAVAAPPDPVPWQRKVEQRVLTRLEAGGAADFVIRLTDRADLSAAAATRDWAERGRVVVDALRRTAERSQRAIRDRLDAAGVGYQSFWITNAIVVRHAPVALAQTLAADPAVADLREVPEYEVPDEQPRQVAARATAAVEWGIANIGADRVWSELDARGNGLVIGSIDTGVQHDHPALVGAYRGTLPGGGFDHNHNWFDPSAVCPEPAPCDNIGHGTHTMGTMAGGDGPGGAIGVAPGARWITAKGCEDEERGCTLPALLASGQWMLAPTDLNGQDPRTDLRPNVVNNSWGDQNRGVEDPFYDDIVNAWNASGIFAVFSNGNDGRAGCDTSASPADGPAAYAVGAYDSAGVIGDFSSRGPGGPGMLKPDIAAPGVNIVSAFPDNRYAAANGTSMAAPHVAGTVALLWSAAPSLVGDIDGTRELLDQSAVDVEDLSCGGTAERNNVFGEGRLNAFAAVQAAPTGSTGVLTGTIRAAYTGGTIAGATVEAVSAGYRRTTVTGADGRYELRVRTGEYRLTVSAYGYATATGDPVEVGTDQTRTVDQELEPVPMATITGHVTDGSGHGWPLYARLTVAGTPLGDVFTSPADGSYRFDVPVGATYTVAVKPEYPGYQTASQTVAVGNEDRVVDVRVPVRTAPCEAPGYHVERSGLGEGFDAGTLPDGWTREQSLGDGWQFTDPGGRTNNTGGSGHFASIDSADGAVREDGYLISPAADLGSVTEPVLEFRSDALGSAFAVEADVSLDDGGSWQNVWRLTTIQRGPRQVRVALPDAAGKNAVRVRFHYRNELSFNGWWEIDDVVLGSTSCAPVPGGLVYGFVRDDRAGRPVTGASVTSPDARAESAATPDDRALDDGFYWLFSPAGTNEFTARHDLGQYEQRSASTDVRPDAATRQDFGLGMAELVLTPQDVTGPVPLDGTRRMKVTVTNIGTGRATYDLAELDDVQAKSASLQQDQPVRREPSTDQGGPYRPEPLVAGSKQTAADSPWTRLGDLPLADLDKVAAVHDGTVYVVGGASGNQGNGQTAYRYDTAAGTWTTIAPLPAMREKAAGGFIGDKLYVAGGWDQLGTHTADTFVYDPATGAWTAGPDAPVRTAAAGNAVLGGRLYLVGGRSPADANRGSRAVAAFDPAANRWSTLADYPEPVSWAQCGALGERLYCAGGQDGGDRPSRRSYVYDPATDHWYRIADLPFTVWGAGSAAANGRLLLSGGVVNGFRSNQGFEYDPVADEWAALPNSQFALTRTAGACGFTKVAGSEGILGNQPYVERLPGYDRCEPGGRDAAWLSVDKPAGSLAPGESADVWVTLDGRRMPSGQPGQAAARLVVHEDTPFRNDALTVTMDAVGPPGWSHVTGTVTGLSRCDQPGSRLPRVPVVVEGKQQRGTTVTDGDGRYSYWLGADNDRVRVSASYDGFTTATVRESLRPGRPATADLTLRRSLPCATVSPDQLDFDHTGEADLTLENQGAASYDYRVEESASWLSVRHGTGPVNADDSEAAQVRVSTTGLSRGQTYRTTVTVTTTDPELPRLDIPVTLRVR